jgi:two-component system response regulator AtoC
MRPVLDLITRASQGSATVLIQGESGTGKELAARAIHDLGSRRTGPFVAIHCAALPDALLESELFGYERGAFTGAVCRKPGRLELADRGTLFLDEIAEVSPQVQVKLLRVLQERCFERLGGTETVHIDVRVVAATHRDLESMVRAATFREDLYYRLNVIPIWLPPLRQRSEDVEALATLFAQELGPRNQKTGIRIERAAIDLLRAQPWPGNIRELHNFVERLILLSDGPSLTVADVERELARKPLLAQGQPAPLSSGPETGTLDQRVREAEREAVRLALERTAGNRTRAARLLGVSRRTLHTKLVDYDLS